MNIMLFKIHIHKARILDFLLVALILSACAQAEIAPTMKTTPSSPPPASPAPPSPQPTPSAQPTSTLAPGQTRVDASGIQQVWVPAGSFLMGTDAAAIQELLAMNPPAWVQREFASEQPQHEVRLTAGYWIDKYEVTNQAFQAFIDAGGYTTQAYWSEAGWQWLSQQSPDSLSRSCMGEAADRPRRCVTWYEAEAYARWRGGRLPTEAEWEFAARGPQSLIYPWGNEFDSQLCNVVDSQGPVAVGSYPGGASWVGALDMAGNAMEWVQDWLDVNYYKQDVSVDPTGPASGRIKIEKGGWWGSNQFVARAAYRHYEDPPVYSDEHIGFRIVSP
jgi:formylglycine-generating enzyme required for sulfatase activity